MGQEGAPNSWRIVKLDFLRKPDAEPQKRIRSCRAIALASVMSKKHLHVGGVDAPHLQVMMTQQLQKHWEWQEDRRKDNWQSCEKIFAMARPREIANFRGEQVWQWIFTSDGGLGRTGKLRTR